MKSNFFLLLTLFSISFFSFSQQGINYQAIVKDSDGMILKNSDVNIKFSIIYDGVNSTPIYIEEHQITTPSDGVVNIYIGSGTKLSTGIDFSEIDWSQNVFLKEELDTDGNYQTMGTNQIASVPIAEYAKATNTSSSTFIKGLGDIIIGSDSPDYPQDIIDLYEIVPGAVGDNIMLGKNILSSRASTDTSYSPSGNIAIGNDAMSEAKSGGNIAIGRSAMSNSDSTSDIAIGSNALEVSKGFENIAIGQRSFDELESGSGNIGIGEEVGFNFYGGNHNVGIGYRAFGSSYEKANTVTNTTFNTGVGYGSSYGLVGNNNTSVGRQAGQLTLGDENTLVGAYASTSENIEIINATAIGANALVTTSNTIQLGNDNIELVNTSGVISATGFVGDGSRLTNVGLGGSIDENGNLKIVDHSPTMTTSQTNNVLIGSGVATGLTDASNNVGIGTSALASATTTYGNIALGSNALRSSSTAFGTSTSSASTALNVAIGNQSMRDMEQGWVNVAIGSTAMLNTKKGDGNIAIGAGTMEDPSFGVNNIALGTDAIHQGENMNSVAIGNQALFNVTNVPDQSNFEQDPDVSNLQEFIARTDNPSTTLDESMYGLPGNIAIGAGAFASPQASTATITEVSMENIAIGHMSMNRVTKQTGGNIAIGSHSLPVMEDGGGIISIGQWSLNQFKEGWGNTILGNGGAQNLEKGSQLTLIGQGVAANAKNIRAATAVGVNAMRFAGKASQNTAFGRLALMRVGETLEMSGHQYDENGDWVSWVVSGTSNIAIGPYSLQNTDSGYENVSIGRSAMISNIGGAQNVAVGDRALRRNNSDFNTGVGRHALETNVEGEFNTALGYFAGSLQNAQGDNANDYNTYLGALTNTVSGSTVQNSTAIGYEALVTTSNTIQLGNDNIELVSTSGVISATGFVGDGSRLTNVDFVVDFDMAGIHNTVIGDGAMSNASGGSYNIAVGKNSMSNNTSGSTNAAFGQNSLESNTTGGDNLALGYNALNNNTTGSRNVVIGKGAASNNDSGNNNVAIGGDALVENFNGNSNIAIGTEALRYNSEGNQNVAIGQGSLSANLVSGNIGIGFNSLTSTVSGSHNVAIGEESMISNVSGFKNVAIGASSMRSAGGSNYQNTSVGHDSSQFINGHNNTAIGFGSGRNIDDSNSTSNNNTFLGKWTGATAETGVLQNSTVIGSDAEVSSDHTMVFGDQDVSKWAFGLTTTDVGKAIQVGSDTTNGNGAYLTTGGTWTNGSSILFKTNFINLSNDWILDKISKLNIRKWDYKNTNETHIGPTSEEFIELFDVGINNENSHISTIDVSGVALKGVQALINENEIQKEQLKNQSDLINELYDRIIALEKKINE